MELFSTPFNKDTKQTCIGWGKWSPMFGIGYQRNKHCKQTGACTQRGWGLNSHIPKQDLLQHIPDLQCCKNESRMAMKINRDTLFSAMVYIPHLPSTITINKSKNVQETLARFSKLYTWHKTLRYEIVYHKPLTGTCTNMTITVRKKNR